MRYAPEHNEATRERILEAAARLFREHGVAEVGLAKVMAEVGLTVGTFYTHFDSKEALLREALLYALDARDEALGANKFEKAIRLYLSPEHRDAAGSGCPTAALVSEVARSTRATRNAFVKRLEPTMTAIVQSLAERRGSKVTPADATAFFGLLVGTLQLARATPDRAASDAILAAGVKAALALAQ